MVLLQVILSAVGQGAEVYHNLKSVIKKKYGQETGHVVICGDAASVLGCCNLQRLRNIS